MYHLFARFIVASLLILLPLLVGCSIVGLIGGAASSTQTKEVAGWELTSVDSGKRITLSMNNGPQLDGRYRGTSFDSKTEYEARYNEWLANRDNRSWYPELLSKVTLTSVTDEEITGTFHGFDYARIYVSSSDHSTIWDVADVESISDSIGGVITGVMLVSESMQGSLPFYSTHLIETGASPEPFEFQIQDVESVVVHGQNNAAAGFLVGAIIDAAFIVAIANSGTDETGGGYTSSSSGDWEGCPIVYTFDQQDYVRDAEPLGGAFFRGAQRTDFVRLERLAPADGTYRIRIATELEETDYLDAVHLLVADHPRGSEVLPTAGGELVVLTNPVAPLKAATFDGGDAQEAISVRDNKYWVSNPFNRNPKIPSQIRDGLVLEFARPVGVETAALAITVKSQGWTSTLPRDLFKLQGEELDAWWDQLNSSPSETATFVGTLMREMLLAVEVWDGESWQPAGSIWGLGSRVESDRALTIALPDTDEGVTRIRVSSTAGLWMIDRAVIDYAASSPESIARIEAVEARDQAGNDVLSSFATADGEYHGMPVIGHQVDMVFNAPAEIHDFDRTVVLEMSGYYKLHIEAEGPSNPELVSKLMNEPGALGQWVLSELHEDARTALASLME